MIEVPLSKGKFAIVDDEDYDLFSGAVHAFCTDGIWYAVKSAHSGSNVYPHRQILERILGRSLNRAEHADHKNGDSLDNRRANIRLATSTENQRNRRKQRTFCGRPTSSIYKGVKFMPKEKRWHATIYIARKPVFLGSYVNEIDAAYAYDKAACERFGDFARTNF